MILDPFLLLDHFGSGPTGRLPGRLSDASASGHRNCHLRAGRRGAASRYLGNAGSHRRRRCAVDDRGQTGSCTKRCRSRGDGKHGRLSALGEPARRVKRCPATLPGSQSRRDTFAAGPSDGVRSWCTGRANSQQAR